MKRTAAGFTLIELMIAMAIVAILTAIAYPSYRETVSRSRRADARAVLLENMQALERQFTLSNSYARNSSGDAVTAPPFPASPRGGTTRYYDISFVGTHDATQYTLQAVPTGSMTGDKCGTLTLNHQQVRGVVAATATVAECWDR